MTADREIVIGHFYTRLIYQELKNGTLVFDNGLELRYKLT
jgi:hypothetical protein